MFDIKKFLVENRIDEKLNFRGDASTMKGLKTKLAGDKIKDVTIQFSPHAKMGMARSMGGISANVTPEQAMKILEFMERI